MQLSKASRSFIITQNGLPGFLKEWYQFDNLIERQKDPETYTKFIYEALNPGMESNLKSKKVQKGSIHHYEGDLLDGIPYGYGS